MHQAIPSSKDIYISDNGWLTREATEDEIREVVNQMSPLNAPGSDSMHEIFYWKRGHIISKNICTVILAFSKHGYILRDLNNCNINSKKGIS